VLELGVGERQVRVALARELEMLAAPAVARLDRDARRAPCRKRRIELGVESHVDAPHERPCGSVLEPRRLERGKPHAAVRERGGHEIGRC